MARVFPSRGIALIVVSSIFPALAIVAVGLRIWARRYTRQALDTSDYVIFFTLLCAIIQAITCILGAVAAGMGLQFSELTQWQLVRYLKVLFVTQFCYIFSLWSVKISVLFFYRSVFSSSRRMRIMVKCMFAFLVAWIIAFFFVTLFQDKPIERNWGFVGTTVNWRVLYVVCNVTDVVLDIAILIMPVFEIKTLHVSTRRKWELISIFWLGAIIVIASVVRLAYVIICGIQFQSEDTDFSDATVDSIIWGSIEPCTSVIAACLPIISALFLKRAPRTRQTNYNPAKGLIDSDDGPASFRQKSNNSKDNALDTVDIIERSTWSGSVSESTHAKNSTRDSINDKVLEEIQLSNMDHIQPHSIISSQPEKESSSHLREFPRKLIPSFRSKSTPADGQIKVVNDFTVQYEKAASRKI